jgi:hypothetical protein
VGWVSKIDPDNWDFAGSPPEAEPCWELGGAPSEYPVWENSAYTLQTVSEGHSYGGKAGYFPTNGGDWVGYRPTKIRITFSAGHSDTPTLGVCIFDKGDNCVLNSYDLPGEIESGEVVEIAGGVDINFVYLYCEGEENYCYVTNIEFYESEGEGSEVAVDDAYHGQYSDKLWYVELGEVSDAYHEHVSIAHLCAGVDDAYHEHVSSDVVLPKWSERWGAPACWNARMLVRLLPDLVGSVLEDYRERILISDPGHPIFDVANPTGAGVQPDGRDIRVYDKWGGEELSFEMACFDPVAGVLELFVLREVREAGEDWVYVYWSCPVYVGYTASDPSAVWVGEDKVFHFHRPILVGWNYLGLRSYEYSRPMQLSEGLYNSAEDSSEGGLDTSGPGLEVDVPSGSGCALLWRGETFDRIAVGGKEIGVDLARRDYLAMFKIENDSSGACMMETAGLGAPRIYLIVNPTQLVFVLDHLGGQMKIETLNASLNDGLWHVVTVQLNDDAEFGERIRLFIDAVEIELGSGFVVTGHLADDRVDFSGDIVVARNRFFEQEFWLDELRIGPNMPSDYVVATHRGLLGNYVELGAVEFRVVPNDSYHGHFADGIRHVWVFPDGVCHEVSSDEPTVKFKPEDGVHLLVSDELTLGFQAYDTFHRLVSGEPNVSWFTELHMIGGGAKHVHVADLVTGIGVRVATAEAWHGHFCDGLSVVVHANLEECSHEVVSGEPSVWYSMTDSYHALTSDNVSGFGLWVATAEAYHVLRSTIRWVKSAYHELTSDAPTAVVIPNVADGANVLVSDEVSGFGLRVMTDESYHAHVAGEPEPGTSRWARDGVHIHRATGGFDLRVETYGYATGPCAISAQIPSLSARLYGGGHVDATVPAFVASVAGLVGEYGRIAVSVPGFTARLYGGGDIDVAFPAFAASVVGESGQPVVVSGAIPAFRAALEGYVHGLARISASVPAFRAALEGYVHGLARISASVPAFRSGLAGEAGGVCVLSASVPSFSAEVTGGAGRVGNVVVSVPVFRAALEGDVGGVCVVAASVPAFRARVVGLVGKASDIEVSIPALTVEMSGGVEVSGGVAASLPSVSAAIMAKTVRAGLCGELRFER